MKKVEKIEFFAESCERLDKLISLKVDETSRAKAQNLIKDKFVFVCEKNVSKSYVTKIGDKIEITLPEPVEIDAEPENIPLDIVYEDDDLIVVNKAKGMVVHPAVGNYTGTLVNALLYHAKDSLSGVNGKIRPGIVHRIDKDTSGVIIVAKNDFAHNLLAEQIKEHSFKREYRAVVYGNVKTDEGMIDAPIGRNPKDRKQMAVLYGSASARNAVTHYKVIERFKGFTFLSLKLETGRTHQIRVHMAKMGFPVAGDAVYGPKKVITELNGQCLH
ncbi:MAG: RluA family pseudouridine synthase, partial [Clostridia bacterium]